MAPNPENKLDAELKELEKRLEAAKLPDEAAQVGYLQYFMSLGTIVGNPYGADVKIGEETVSLDIVEVDSEAVVEEKAKAFALRIKELLETLPPPVVPKPERPPAPKPPPETNERMVNFETQAAQRLDELASFGIIGITNKRIRAIDGEKYGPPSWKEIKNALTLEKLLLIDQLEIPTLLMVPDGMSFSEYIAKAVRYKPAPKKKLRWSKSNNINIDADKNGTLISGVTQYDKINDGGTTKQERLQQRGALGWQVHVVDGGDEATPSTLNKSADTLLAEFKQQGFHGLSVESYFALQMYGTMRGKQFDINKRTWLLYSYLTEIGERGAVLFSDWDEQRVRLSWEDPDFSDEDLGARRSVRVL